MIHRFRAKVGELFARDPEACAIALCSGALNEGLNLQGAAALAHLDLPTTLRVPGQRVGPLRCMSAVRYETWLDNRRREIAILVVAAHWGPCLCLRVISMTSA